MTKIGQDAGSKSLTMEPEARRNYIELDGRVTKVANDVATVQGNIVDLNTRTNKNAADIDAIETQLGSVIPGYISGNNESPNTLGRPEAIDRYGLSFADAIAWLKESAKQKAQGQYGAGKYSLTPQNFVLNSDGLIKRQPYGKPPIDGSTTTSINNVSVPIITDACYQYYDQTSGLHFRWDQFQADSFKFKGLHWFLDGPVLSVSIDGLSWVNVRTIVYDNSGYSATTAFWVDRDNRCGYGNNALIVSSQNVCTALPSIISGNGTKVGNALSGNGDSRLYWDGSVTGGFLVMTINPNNTYIIIRLGKSLTNINDAYTFNDPIFNNLRVECPGWLLMKDTVTGQYQQVITTALQGTAWGKIPTHCESAVVGTCKYSVSEITMNQPFRYVEWGFFAYAHVIVDPLQQDGTGGTKNGCDSAVYNVGCYAWWYLNGAVPIPHYGFGGGAFISAEVYLTNGVPMVLPNKKFEAAMSGRQFIQQGPAQGVGAKNPGWIMEVGHKSDVWRGQMDINSWEAPTTNTIRFHFGPYFADYIIEFGRIDFVPNKSGSTVLSPNNRGGIDDGTTRIMPMTRNFVTNKNNTLVWEYDYGRIRIYNTSTGEIMSELIFPDAYQLTAVEIIGDDFFIGGFTFKINQDGGLNY